jgi:hypothetical protein
VGQFSVQINTQRNFGGIQVNGFGYFSAEIASNGFARIQAGQGLGLASC